MMLALEKKEGLSPVCPHCEKKLETLFMRELASFFGKRYVYFCQYCHKVLGVSHRKGFFMG